MLASERKQKILHLIEKNNAVQITDLAKIFGVTEMTIRRDLDDLDRENSIRRVRGGAIHISGSSIQRTAFHSRTDEYSSQKKRIGKLAASFIVNNDTVLFDSGTTTIEIAKNLNFDLELFTMTMSIPIAMELAKYKNNQVYIPGGFISDPNELNITGSPTIRNLEQFSINKLFLGASGFHKERGLVYLNQEETTIRNKMVEISKEVIVVIDSSKFGKDGLVSLEAVGYIDKIITDEQIPEEYVELLEDLGIELLIAKT